MIPINRDWLTLAFGVGLVTVVVGLSVRHNVQWRAAGPAEPEVDAAAPAATMAGEPAPPVAAAVETGLVPAPPPADAPAPPAVEAPAARPADPSVRPAATRTPRFDVSVPVVHKHRFGSCEGTLRATDAGLLFGSTDEDDTFQLSFRDIDRFDVVGATLTVRRRGGRTWNFSGQDDRVDGLLAFHRAVERARR